MIKILNTIKISEIFELEREFILFKFSMRIIIKFQ